jgi:hypothetical protein
MLLGRAAAASYTRSAMRVELGLTPLHGASVAAGRIPSDRLGQPIVVGDGEPFDTTHLVLRMTRM